MTDEQFELTSELIVELRSLRLAIERHNGSNDRDRPLTREEAAEYLGVHKDTLYRWAVEEGRIAHSRLGEGARAPLRFRKEDLDDYLQRQRIGTVEEIRMRRWS